MAICWLNGKIVPAHQASISVFDHGLLYGDGVFEGIRFYQGHVFELTAHLQRLYQSAQAITLQIPYTFSELMQAVQDTVAAYEQPSGYIRLVVTRGPGPLGLNPATCESGNVFMIVDQLALLAPEIYQQGAKVIIATTRAIPIDSLDSKIKSLNYLNHILARIEANHAHADEAILLNHAGHVTEGSADNIFIVQQDRLLTPPVSDGALNGITRQLILQFAQQLNLPNHETTLTAYDLYTAQEAFLTGTGAELIPIRQIDGRQIGTCPGPIFEQLHHAFKQYIEQQSITV